mgnify:FL=1
MSRDKTYFLSDLHLGARYLDRPHERERMIADFLESIADDAETLYLVGDVLDYWYEYRTVAPRGYLRFFGALASLADRGVRIVWLTGNHDIWLFDYLRDEIGLTVVDGSVDTVIDGRRFFISHGDGLGRLKPSFRFIRAMFRNRFCQWLYGGIHPRWTVAFAHRWSSSSRGYDSTRPPVYEGEMRRSVEEWARGFVADNPDVDYIVLGHHHVMVDEPVGDGCRLVILGDWIYNFSYAVFDGSELKLKQFASAIDKFNKT